MYAYCILYSYERHTTRRGTTMTDIMGNGVSTFGFSSERYHRQALLELIISPFFTYSLMTPTVPFFFSLSLFS
ncbi:hypothetical protein LMH87_011303 [Akanthomyces muscarius]|uniref:Uncharacterized protein n=1 Tax=Akanthomyces muscarius TaxID=2231603 RepID=A0A9W8UIB9_AKAMU|nr:hypothetical protein LMH87_011303 [Akanthomyces muscarius]KAJ4150558.1 hypothetical protein LMH87_011303 [Akanthomyces muscarius]